MTSVPSTASPKPLQPSHASPALPTALQITAAKAMNQIATERSTWTTSAARKNPLSGKMSWIPGVRERTSSMASKPEPIRASTPSHNHARASAAGVPEETVTTGDGELATLTSRKTLRLYCESR